MKASLIVFALGLFIAHPSFADSASLKVDVALSPAGSFDITTGSVRGVAYRSAEGVFAKDIEIDMKSLSTGISLRDRHMKERLLVDKFPKARLLKATGKNGQGMALIEIKGMKVKATGTYKIEGNVLKAQFPLKMSDLEIKDVRYMGVGAKDVVTVNIDVPVKDMGSMRVPATNARKGR